MLPLRSDDVELVMVAGGGMRHEQFPIAAAAHAHGMTPRVPEIEVADHADAPRVRREHDECDAWNAIQHHRMRAELVIEALLGSFAKQIEIEIGQDRRKAIGIFEIDGGVAEPCAQLVALRSV